MGKGGAMSLPPLPKELAAFSETQARHCALNDMVQAYGQACREQALEEAAQICSHKAETKRLFLNEAHYLECAEAIRSLK